MSDVNPFAQYAQPAPPASANPFSQYAPAANEPQPAQPITAAPSPYAGQTMSATPDRGWLGTLDDGVRMLTSKIPFSDRFSAGMDTLTGTGLPGADYSTNLQNERWRDAALASQHPILSKVLGYGGGGAAALATLPEGAVASGATMLAKAASGARAGAAYGAAQGASDTPDLTNISDAAIHIATGAAAGGTIGAALPVVASGIGSAVNAGASAIDGGAPGISRAAQQHLLSALQADGPQAVTAKLSTLGDQGMLVDAGPSLLGKGQGAVLNSDDAKTTLVNALLGRAQGANGRINTDVDAAFGPAEDPQLVTNSIRDTRSAVDNQKYPAALQNAPPVDTSRVMGTLDRMLAQSAAGTMTNKALTSTRNMLMESREVPALDANGNQIMGPNGQAQTEVRPSPVYDAGKLHAIKQELDNVIQYDAPGLGVPPGALSNQQGAFKLIRGQINDSLENQVPGYADANAASSALAKRMEAVQTGTSILDSGKTAMTPTNLAQQFGAMEPGEQIALAKGARGEIDRVLDTRANDLVAGKNVIKGEGDWNRARLATVFGDAPTNAVINTMDRESQFANTTNKIVENSQTAQRNAAAQAMRAPTTGGHPLINPDSTLTGIGMTLAKKGYNALADALRTDPTSSYGELAKVLSAQGPQRDAHLSDLAAALMRKSGYAAAGQWVGNTAALAAALGGEQYLDDRLQPR